MVWGMKMSKSLEVYIACPWSDKGRAKAAAQQFKEAGMVLTTAWWDEEPTEDTIRLSQYALRDIDDVLNCHVFVLLNTQPRGQETSGKAVETGIAISTLKHIVLVGDGTNIFHHLRLTKVRSVEEAVLWCQQLEPVGGTVEIDLKTAQLKRVNLA